MTSNDEAHPSSNFLVAEHHKLQPMKYPDTGFSSFSYGLPKKDLIGLLIIALIGVSGLIIFFSSPVLFKNHHSANIKNQPTKNLSAADLNSEKTANNIIQANHSIATHNLENTKM